MPDILAFYESEESQQQFAEWKKQREAEQQEVKTKIGQKRRAHRVKTVRPPFSFMGPVFLPWASAWRSAVFHAVAKMSGFVAVKESNNPNPSPIGNRFDYIGLVRVTGLEPARLAT